MHEVPTAHPERSPSGSRSPRRRLLLALGRDDNADAVRWSRWSAALAGFLVTLPLITGFDVGTAAMQFVETLPGSSAST
jgi:hypothetical protein